MSQISKADITNLESVTEGFRQFYEEDAVKILSKWSTPEDKFVNTKLFISLNYVTDYVVNNTFDATDTNFEITSSGVTPPSELILHAESLWLFWYKCTYRPDSPSPSQQQLDASIFALTLQSKLMIDFSLNSHFYAIAQSQYEITYSDIHNVVGGNRTQLKHKLRELNFNDLDDPEYIQNSDEFTIKPKNIPKDYSFGEKYPWGSNKYLHTHYVNINSDNAHNLVSFTLEQAMCLISTMKKYGTTKFITNDKFYKKYNLFDSKSARKEIKNHLGNYYAGNQQDVDFCREAKIIPTIYERIINQNYVFNPPLPMLINIFHTIERQKKTW